MKTRCTSCGEELGKKPATDALCGQCGEELDVPDGSSVEADDSESAGTHEQECPECFTASEEFRKDQKCPCCGYEGDTADDY